MGAPEITAPAGLDRATVRAAALAQLIQEGGRQLGNDDGSDPRFLNAIARPSAQAKVEQETPQPQPTKPTPFLSPLRDFSSDKNLLPERYSGAARPLNSLL